MKTQPRRGSWRQVAPGTYVKNIGTYEDVKFGATARVSFVPFPTCEIMDANGAHAAIPTPADAKKFITAAKKVYTKDTKATTARLQKRDAARTASPSTRIAAPRSPKAEAVGTDAMTKLTQAQRLEAEIKTLRGRLPIVGPRPSPEKSRLNAEIRMRQAAVRKLLPKKYRTAKQFAAAIRKTYEEEASTKRIPFTPGYTERRSKTLSAIGAEYME